MRVLSKFKGLSRKAIIAGTLAAAVVGIAGFKVATVQAQNISIGGAKDCDSNAVMYCGASSVDQLVNKYNHGDAQNSSGRIKNIYNYFGINQSEVQSMNNASTHVERGKVSKSGNVYDSDGKVIATNAVTAGRQYMPGSTKVTRNGTTFYTRSPSVSFLSNTLDAYIVMKDGQFSYAILAACGNPVSAHPKPKPEPKPKPNYDIVKQVKVKGTDNFKKNVSVKSGTHVIYSIDVKSTGETAVKNVVVKDQLPAHVEYVNGTLKRNGTDLTGQANKFFSNGIVIESMAPGTEKRFTFEAIVGPNDTPEKCKDDTITNVAKIDAPGLPQEGSNAVVDKSCKPEPKTPQFSCESLQGIAGSRISYTFKAKSTAINGAKITGYQFNFGDGQSTTVNSNALTASTTHNYPNLDVEKTYTATVTVTALVNGQLVSKTAPACATPVKIAPQPPKPPQPSAECTSLNLTVGANRSITAQTTVATQGEVQLTSINYDFDDGTTQLVNSLSPVSHTFAADGDYLVKATVTFNIAGQNVTSLCQAPISFVPPPTPPNCEEENGGQPCVEPETPTCEEAEGKSCEEVPVTLANTGPGSTAAMFVAVTALSAIGYRTMLRRRLGQR